LNAYEGTNRAPFLLLRDKKAGFAALLTGFRKFDDIE
jgi:hypothetical protein